VELLGKPPGSSADRPGSSPRHKTEKQERGPMRRTKLRPFWESPSLDELAEQQGVTPVEDLQEVAKLWPVNDDPDELLGFILQERRARRQVRRGRK
jgi:hypothetical protein